MKIKARRAKRGKMSDSNGKNSLIGEFLLSLARAPESVQEDIIIYGLKKFMIQENELIQPYPMLKHMLEILKKNAEKS